MRTYKIEKQKRETVSNFQFSILHFQFLKMLAQYYHILKDLISFKTISSDPQYASDMQNTSSYLLKLLEEY
jgi:hypothetical protein